MTFSFVVSGLVATRGIEPDVAADAIEALGYEGKR